MRKVVSVLRALGVLIAIWGVLALVAFAAGALPGGGGGAPAGDDLGRPGDTRVAASPSKGTPAGGAATKRPASAATPTKSAPAADAGRPAPPEPASAPSNAAAVSLARYLACDPAVVSPSIATAEVLGDPRPELALGCGSVVHVLSAQALGEPGALLPMTVATFDVTSEAPDVRIQTGGVAAGDVDGDSEADLVLGFHRTSGNGGLRGGDVFLVRRSASGAFEEPRRLAPISSGGIVVAALDDRPGLDIAALNLGNPYARRPSDVWVFGGGPSPSRIAQARSALGGSALASGDLDRDGKLDLVVASADAGRVDVLFGDGNGRFPRTSVVNVPGAAELAVADMDGDGTQDILVRGQGLHLIRGGSADVLEPQPIDARASVRQIRVVDLDGDGKRDVLALDASVLVWLRQRSALAFEAQPLVRVPVDALWIERFAVADLDADGKIDAALLGRPRAEGAAWEIVLASDVRDDVARSLAPSAIAMPDAPLRLRISLR